MMVVAFLKSLGKKWFFWVLVDALVFLVFALIAQRYYPLQAQMEYQIDLSLKILDGQIPYVGFTSEYPPLALLVYLLPALLFRSTMGYYIAFVIELLLFDIIAMFLIARTSPRLGISAAKALTVHALAIIAVGPIMVVSHDVVPAVMVLAALALFISGRTNTAWAILGLGLMTKLYPIIIAPVFFLYQLRRAQYRQIARGITIFIVVVAVLSLPWLLLDAKGFSSVFTYHLERGLHSETTYGSALILGKILGLVQVEGVYNFGSWNLDSPLADRLAGFSFLIMAVMLCAIYFLYRRTLLRDTGNTEDAFVLRPAAAILLRYAIAAVFAFILFAKVFSMQYLLWLCPLLPLFSGRWQIPVYTCFFVAGAFSQFVYPYHYQLFESFIPSLVVMIVIRNMLLLVCGVFALLPGESGLRLRPDG